MYIKIKIVTVITLALFAFSSCTISTADKKSHDNNQEKHEEGVVVLNEQQREALDLKLGTFQMRNLTTVVKVNGELAIAPENKAEITTLIGGNVKAIKVFHGDKVRKGQVLAILEHPDFISLQESYAEYASSLEYLEQDYKRQKDLSERNAGSSKEYQKAKADYYTAKARYQGLRSRLLLLNLSPDEVQKGNISNVISLYSPINGFVNKINIKLGSFVGPTDKLFEITDNSAIHADFMIYEKDVHLIKMGQLIHFTVANRVNEEFTAIIFAIGKEFEANTRAVQIHTQINEKTAGLVPGMYVTGHLHTDEILTKTLPADAIVTEGSKSYIFVLIDEESAGHKHKIANESHKSKNHEGHNHEEDNHEGDNHEENNHEGHNHEEDNHEGHTHEQNNHEGYNHEEDNHEGHNHEGDKHEGEEHHDGSKKIAFRMVEVMLGNKDAGYIEVKEITPLPKNAKIVMNAAYYLLADMKKEETEHKH